MSRTKAMLMTASVLVSLVRTTLSYGQEDTLQGYFHVGLELGEVPFHGSFKPGISVGYHFNDYIYTGFVYQLADSIARGDTSFNAKAVGLDGLLGSSETVGQRAYLQARVRPHRYSPYASLGFVFNDRDTETIRFDDRLRHIGGAAVSGPLTIAQARPAGLRPALGLGYSYTFDTGFELFTEWAGYWMFGAPAPELKFRGVSLPKSAEQALRTTITDEFTSSPFNSYHLFQAGAGYTF